MEDSELNSDRTVDDDKEATSSPRISQCSKAQSANCYGRQSPPGTELQRQQSAADDTMDSELKDDDWTYPDDNSPSGGGPQPRERRDSGVGSSLTRSSR